jgi:hypothetical protein
VPCPASARASTLRRSTRRARLSPVPARPISDHQRVVQVGRPAPRAEAAVPRARARAQRRRGA